VLAVEGRIDTATVGGLCRRLRSLIGQSSAVLVACDVGALGDCDLVAIDVLARLGLTAGQLACAFELWGASDRLVELLAFVGLQEILPVRERHGHDTARPGA
jgi:ABC-type transporter Mla MlaB component